MFLVFSNHFDVLMSKIIFKKSKNITGMYFDTKNYLKSNNNHTAKQVCAIAARDSIVIVTWRFKLEYKTWKKGFYNV